VVADVVRLTIRAIDADPRNAPLLGSASALGVPELHAIHIADVVFLRGPLEQGHLAELHALLVDPLLQTGSWDVPDEAAPGTGAIEVGKLPGVTDAAADALLLAARTIGAPVSGAATATRYEMTGDLDHSSVALLARRLLSNPVIERWDHGTLQPSFIDSAADVDVSVEIVPILESGDEALAAINRDRGLSLDPAELRVIADHFERLGRNPTDVELETLAQTWSEHCAHKTFRAAITTADGTSVTPLLRQLRDATDAIAAPFLRSAFVGNAGIVSFEPGVTLAVKAETHNHPSAVEPFGGANTGVGGVIRDVMGAAHRPIAITDILCFGPADLPVAELPEGSLHPRLIEDGVVAGVADYGNKIGLPTVAGAVLYDRGYVANPLVYAGCIGIADDAEPLTGPHPGDLVVLLGGRTGRDGLRGATFSSATMDATTGDVAGASVQIGDPITEKLLIDLLANAHGLYTAITDCGAGGLSSAVGEMAEHVGAAVDLATAPLKYPGLRPWEIWLSEAQERMVVSVRPSQLNEMMRRSAEAGVEASAIGVFTGDGQLTVRYGDVQVLQLSTEFLHDGRPQRQMSAELPAPHRNAVPPPKVTDVSATLLALLAHPNIASKERIVRRYDHEILGATMIRPLVGAECDAPADGVVLTAPGSASGIAIGIGVNPWFGLADPERMAHAVVDEAIRNVVAVGGNPDAVALLDNFSWGDPRRPSTLGELVAAVRGCCDASVAHGAPFVSGKDSLNNEYLGADGQRHSVPPTLVITAVAHVPDPAHTVTSDLKSAGNALVLVGRTDHEFAGSHLQLLLGDAEGFDGAVPAPDPNAPARYRALHRAIRSGRIAACHDVSEGGLAVAVAEMCIGGRLGARLKQLGHDDVTTALFSESNGRFVCEVSPDDVGWLADVLDEPVTLLGLVTSEPELRLGKTKLTIDQLVKAFTGASG
jgi:phosphoribosylformylglycinamidine synthase subunit PurSL